MFSLQVIHIETHYIRFLGAFDISSNCWPTTGPSLQTLKLEVQLAERRLHRLLRKNLELDRKLTELRREVRSSSAFMSPDRGCCRPSVYNNIANSSNPLKLDARGVEISIRNLAGLPQDEDGIATSPKWECANKNGNKQSVNDNTPSFATHTMIADSQNGPSPTKTANRRHVHFLDETDSMSNHPL